MDIKNVAAVMVTGELPGLAKPGQRIDINVSAIGKAKSLRGGNLLLTTLRGIDGQVYALAQGRSLLLASRPVVRVPVSALVYQLLPACPAVPLLSAW